MSYFVLRFVIPVACGSGVFAALLVNHYGWNAVTYNGADPWSLLFRAIGAAAVPTVIALALAGAIKIFKRGAYFLNIWLPIFILVSVIFAYLSF